jgi:hypothetical protein
MRGLFVRGHGVPPPAIKTRGDACLRRKIPCTLNRPLWFAGENDPREAALRHANEGRTAELDSKSYFGARQKYIIKLSLFRLLTLDLKMSH